MQDKITNVRIAGLGGMGVLKASLILGELLFECGYDVKKAEVHGMSQRGGSISSDVRFGKKVVSPMIPDGKIDFLLSARAGVVGHPHTVARARRRSPFGKLHRHFKIEKCEGHKCRCIGHAI